MAEIHTTKKKNKVPEIDREMPFWDHLRELRGHLIRIFVAIIVLAVVAFFNRNFIFDHILLAPKEPEFITNRALCYLGRVFGIEALCMGDLKLDIINIQLSGQFTTHMYISFFAGLLLAIPYVIWEIWRFIRPALYQKEKTYSRGAVFVTSLLFILGVLFAYYLIVPLTLNFFGSYQVSDAVRNQISLNSYISTVVSVTLSLGVIFQFPVFVYFLTKVGLVTPEFLMRSRKYTIIILLTVAAIITPPDVLSQILVMLPLYALYEISIQVAKSITRKERTA